MIDANSLQAKRARQILTVIKERPDSLDMDSWHSGPDAVLAGREVPCGTTLCVAGWAAHFAGYTVEAGVAQRPSAKTPSQVARTGYAVSRVAATWLDIHDGSGPNLFYTREDVAVACLKRMASGEPYSEDMLTEEEERSEASHLESGIRMHLLLDISANHLRD